MKKIAFMATVLGAELLLTSPAAGQGTLYVSNLGQTPTRTGAIGSDAWIAQDFYTFITDPNSYALNSIQLLMNPASGNPTGFSVSLYDSVPGAGAPLNNLGSLVGTDPAAGGIFSYTASGITILPGRFYYVVVTSQTPLAQGTYNWSTVYHGTAHNGNWNIDDVYYASTDGSSWTRIVRQDVFQLAIYATAVPEPATCSLVAMGLMLLGFRWSRQVN